MVEEGGEFSNFFIFNGMFFVVLVIFLVVFVVIGIFVVLLILKVLWECDVMVVKMLVDNKKLDE